MVQDVTLYHLAYPIQITRHLDQISSATEQEFMNQRELGAVGTNICPLGKIEKDFHLQI